MLRCLTVTLPDGFRRGRVTRALALVALAGFALILAGCGADDPFSTIPQKGEHNQKIWFVYNFLWIGAAVVFVLVEGLLVYAMIRYRGKPRTAHGRPIPVHGNTTLEIAWTIIPAIVIVLIGIPTLTVLRDLSDTPDDPDTVRVDVVAHQFFWEFIYPDLGENVTSTNTLRIPTDTVIDINLQSADVIHSFWVPQLAGHIDNIPGRTNTMWLTADQPGTYAGECAEFCGVGHALMKFQVEALVPEDFTAWVNEQNNPSAGGEADPQAGMELVVNGPCAACHVVEGTSAQGSAGPPLTGFASRPQIAGVLENTPENLATWLADPPAVKPGTAMPNLNLSERDIANLVAYLQTLEEE